MKVFIENKAGSEKKNIFDEETLEFKKSVSVSRAYPYPYGFVLNTTAEDGGNVDCFVITGQELSVGDTVECEPIALMEQFETSWGPDSEKQEADHNVIAVPVGETAKLTEEIKNKLAKFISHVFDHIEGKQVEIEGFLDKESAANYVANHQ